MYFKSLPLIALGSLLALATAIHVEDKPSCFQRPEPLQLTGDYSDTGDNTKASIDGCTSICKDAGYIIVAGAMGGTQCWCGDSMPDPKNEVPMSNCNSPCNGAEDEMCMSLSTLLQCSILWCSLMALVVWYMEFVNANSMVHRWRTVLLGYVVYSLTQS